MACDIEGKHGLITGGNSGIGKATAEEIARRGATIELDRRLGGSGLAAKALHPGVVGTSFAQGAEGSKLMGVTMRLLRPFLATPAQGAATSVHLATASDEEIGRGLYWADADVKDRLPIASDGNAARRLWDASAELVGLKSDCRPRFVLLNRSVTAS